MKTPSISTEAARAARAWHVVDATGQVVGRLASQVAFLLRGKHNPWYTPHVDTGDFVIVINAEKLVFKGRKMSQKMYHHHTGWVGNLRSRTAEELVARRPETVIEMAVRGMLPKTTLGRHMGKKLKVYAGADHPHQAQRPTVAAIES